MSSTVPLLPHDRAVDASLRDARALLAELAPSGAESQSALESAAMRAESLAHGLEDTAGATRLAVLTFAADSVAGLALVGDGRAPDVDALTDGLTEIAGVAADEARVAVYLAAIGDPRLLGLPPALAIETTLRLLVAFAPVRAATFWLLGADGSLRRAARAGTGRGMRAAAHAVLDSTPGARMSRIDAAPVSRWQHPAGAVAVCPRGDAAGQQALLVHETARFLGLALERELLLDRSAARERTLVAAGERRLTRLGLDVHDGPLQDLGAAGRELFLAEETAAAALARGPARDSVLARLAYVREMTTAAEAGLRELARSAESPTMLARPLRALVEREVGRLVTATEVEADVRLEGDLDALTGSQRIALTHIVQESLNNVREHSGARSVRVSIVRRHDRVEAEIVDDGHGFDVGRTLVRAARRGRLGLIGMNERALLLGGVLDVRSSPGGPTAVTVTLPAWSPLAGRAASAQAVGLDAVAR